MAAWGSYLLGQIQRAQGRLAAAVSTYGEVLEATTGHGHPPLAAAGVAYVGMAAVSYQRGELQDALRLATDGVALCRQLAYTPPLITGLTTLAWVRQALGDPDAAREAIDEARHVAPSRSVVDLLNPLRSEQARLLLAQGDLASAVAVEALDLDTRDVRSYPREADHLVLARVLVAQGRARSAIDLLQRLHAGAEADARAGSLIRIQVLRALALEAAAEHSSALEALGDAIRLASVEGYVRVFADEGAPMAALMREFVVAQRNEPTAATVRVPLNYLGRLARAFETEASQARSGARSRAEVSTLVEPLSEREIDVLRLMVKGEPNQEIAATLYVSIGTVKKHVTHIFEKLGARNRTEATARARELGLLH